MVNKYHKAFRAAATVISHSRKVTIPGLAGAAVDSAMKYHYDKKVAKIKKGGIVTKKTKAQLKKNKRISKTRQHKGY